METSRKLLGTNLKRIREGLKWSQAKLAEESDLSLKMIQKIEYSQTSPSPETLDKVSRALGCSIADLYSGSTFQGQSVGHSSTWSTAGTAAVKLDHDPGLALVAKFLDAPRDIHLLVRGILDKDPSQLRLMKPEFVTELRQLLELL